MNPAGKSLPRWAFRAAIALFVAIGVLIAWPEPDAKLLVPADGWEMRGGFYPVQPAAKDIRSSVFNNPQTRYWRSWNPDTGSQPGYLRSKPFFAAGTIAVPYNGFAGEPGVNTYLECVESGRRIYLATGRTNTQWSEVLLDPHADFCSGQLRVVAVSDSTQNYVSLGTPSEISWLSALKRSALPALWFLTFVWAVIGGWFHAFSQYFSARRWGVDPLAAGLIGIGLIGYLQFFVYWFVPRLGDLFALLIVLSGLFWTGRYLRARAAMPSPQNIASFRLATGIWLLVAASLLAMALIGDAGAGPWGLNGRFTPARWSSDNQLPGIVARMLISNNHANPGDMGTWAVADRPPLAYGWHATMHSVLRGFTIGNDGRYLFDVYELATGIVLNTSWAALLCMLMPRLGFSRFKSLLVVASATLCAFFIFNSLYIWPKLLSGTFTLMAAWMLLGMDPDAPRLRQYNRGLLVAAALCALGLLTHGGSAFGIVVAIALAAAYRGLPSPKGAAIAAAAAIALLIPWSLWQAYIQPPGNALVKYAFAGTFGFGEEKIGVLDTILRSYYGLSFDTWLARKYDGLSNLLWRSDHSCGLGEMGVSYSFVDRWRVTDFIHVMPSLNFLLIGFLALLAAKLGRRGGPALKASIKLIAFALATIGFSLLITWDCHINHHQAYQALIALHLGLIVALMGWGRMGWIALAANALYGLVVWVFEPLGHFPRYDYAAVASFAACAAVWILVLRASRTADEELRH